MKIEWYMQKGYISRIVETELQRYADFFEHSYKENIEHSTFNLEHFPRWSIISGYYAMHDITKLFLAKKLAIKVDFNVHKITIMLLKEVIKDKEIIKLFNIAYKEFIEMANDLSKAKKERTKAQYYTGTAFMKEKYKAKAKDFLDTIVKPYIKKMEEMIQ